MYQYCTSSYIKYIIVWMYVLASPLHVSFSTLFEAGPWPWGGSALKIREKASTKGEGGGERGIVL